MSKTIFICSANGPWIEMSQFPNPEILSEGDDYERELLRERCPDPERIFLAVKMSQAIQLEGWDESAEGGA